MKTKTYNVVIVVLLCFNIFGIGYRLGSNKIKHKVVKGMETININDTLNDIETIDVKDYLSNGTITFDTIKVNVIIINDK